MPSPDPEPGKARRNDNAQKEAVEDESSKPKIAGPSVALLPQLLTPGSEWIHAQQQSRWRLSVQVKGTRFACVYFVISPRCA